MHIVHRIEKYEAGIKKAIAKDPASAIHVIKDTFPFTQFFEYVPQALFKVYIYIYVLIVIYTDECRFV